MTALTTGNGTALTTGNGTALTTGNDAGTDAGTDADAATLLVRSAAAAVLRCPLPDGPAPRSAISAWDSLAHIELIYAIEEEAGVRFSPEDLAGLDSLAAFADAVRGAG